MEEEEEGQREDNTHAGEQMQGSKTQRAHDPHRDSGMVRQDTGQRGRRQREGRVEGRKFNREPSGYFTLTDPPREVFS